MDKIWALKTNRSESAQFISNILNENSGVSARAHK